MPCGSPPYPAAHKNTSRAQMDRCPIDAHEWALLFGQKRCLATASVRIRQNRKKPACSVVRARPPDFHRNTLRFARGRRVPNDTLRLRSGRLRRRGGSLFELVRIFEGQESLSANPSGSPRAGSIFPGSAGVNSRPLSASTAVGNDMIAWSAVMTPSGVSILSRFALWSIR